MAPSRPATLVLSWIRQCRLGLSAQSVYDAQLREPNVTDLALIGQSALHVIAHHGIALPRQPTPHAHRRRRHEADHRRGGLTGLGKPRAFHVIADPADASEKTIRIPAKYSVYFPRLKDHWATTGRGIFTTSHDNLDQVDGITEAVTAAQMLDIEPGTVMQVGASDLTQLKPEHPRENLRELLREVTRMAGLPSGVPLEALLMDFSDINYSGARSMHLAFDDAMAYYRAPL